MGNKLMTSVANSTDDVTKPNLTPFDLSHHEAKRSTVGLEVRRSRAKSISSSLSKKEEANRRRSISLVARTNGAMF